MAVIDLVIPHSRRLCDLHITARASYFLPFFAMPQNSVDSLERLAIDVSTRSKTRVPRSLLWEEPATTFVSACRLRHVNISSDGSKIKLDLMFLSWFQLTELHLLWTYTSLIVAHKVLRECINLSDCTLCLLDEDASDRSADASLFTLPWLKKLWLMVDKDGECCLHFFQSLRLPSLRELRLESDYGASLLSSGLTTHLNPFSSSLEIFNINISLKGHIGRLLEAVPSLTTLSLGFPNAVDTTTTKKIFRGELLPKLKYLEYRAALTSMALDVMETWWTQMRTQTGLDSIMFLNDCRGNERDRISKLVAEGLNIRTIGRP